MIKADNLLQESYLQMSINPAKNCKWPYRSIFSRNFIKLIIIFFFFLDGSFIFQNPRALPCARIAYWVLSRNKHEPMLPYLFIFLKIKSFIYLFLRLIHSITSLGLRACEVCYPKLGDETLKNQWNRFGGSFLPCFTYPLSLTIHKTIYY